MEGMRGTRTGVVLIASFLLVASGFALSAVTSQIPNAFAAGPVSAQLAYATLTRQGLVIPMGGFGSFDAYEAGTPAVVFDGSLYRMWYFGCTPSFYCQIGTATSPNGWTWTKVGAVLRPAGGQESLIAYPSVVRVGSSYRMYYGGSDGARYRIFAASSPDGLNWTRLGLAVDVGPPGAQDAYMAVYPFVIYQGGEYVMWYTGISGPFAPNAALMLATSTDGLLWTKHGVVLTAGVSGSPDGYQVAAAGVLFWQSAYRMFYSGYADASTISILYAESADRSNWTRKGVALSPLPPYERSVGSPDPMVTANGTWLVYYTARAGTSDLQIYLATYTPPATGGTTGTSGFDLSLILLFPLVLVAAVGVLAFVFLVGRPKPPR